MKKSAQWWKLVAVAMVLSVCAVAVWADEAQPARTAETVEEAAATMDSDVQCVPAETLMPVFTTALDQVRQNSCGCLDQCRFDFQCGPGGSCIPVGPCGCKECAATS